MPERDWLYDVVEGIRTDQRELAGQFRLEMAAGQDRIREEIKRIREEMQVQNGRVRKSEDRLTIIETERKEEDKQAVKRGVWTGLVASAGLTGIFELAKSIFHR